MQTTVNAIAVKDLHLKLDYVHLFTVTVKIVKVWTLEHNKIPIGVEAIFVDNEGSVIQGTSTKRMVKVLQKKLIEGTTVNISNFDLEENTPSKYQRGRVDHACRMMMIYGTQVVPCRPDLSILTNGIRLVSYHDISAVDRQYFVDVIGQLVSRTEVSYVDKMHARKIDIELRDDSNVTLKGVLWESYADKIIELAPESGVVSDGPVILLQFALVSSYQGDTRVQSAVHSTKMYINADIPEFIDFSVKKKDNGSSSITFLTADHRSLKPDAWLNMDNHRTPQQIKDSVSVGSYILFLRFVRVDENAPWFYMACSNCNGNVKQVVVGDACTSTKCAGQAIVKIVPKFRVKFMARGVKDENITVVVFEEMISKFINKSCQQVFEEWKAEDDEYMIPMDFCEMLHRDFLTRVRITDYNLKGEKFKEFSIDVITDDVGVLSQYINNTTGVESSVVGANGARLKGTEVVVEDPVEDASNDVEGFVTPMKRSSQTDTDDEHASTIGTQKSSNKMIKKNIKQEKP